MLSAKDFDFVGKPAWQPLITERSLAANTTKVLGLKPGESVKVTEDVCNAMRRTAFSRNVPYRTKRLGGGWSMFTRL